LHLLPDAASKSNGFRAALQSEPSPQQTLLESTPALTGYSVKTKEKKEINLNPNNLWMYVLKTKIH